MDSRDIEHYFTSHKRILITLFIVVLIVSASGFFVGLLQTHRETGAAKPTWEDNYTLDPHREHGDLATAPSYSDQHKSGWKTNDDWGAHFDQLRSHDFPRTPTQRLDEENLTKVLAARESRRAFDTAPPTVPHAIDEKNPLACIACHGPGNARLIGDRRTPTMSHPYFQNCTQCHAPATGQHELKPLAGPDTGNLLSAGNTFSGITPIHHGKTAFEGAPPVLPHPVWMRQNCLSCHGEGRPSAIRTSHPQRQNCLQCHASDQSLDNRERIPNKLPSFTPLSDKKPASSTDKP